MADWTIILTLTAYVPESPVIDNLFMTFHLLIGSGTENENRGNRKLVSLQV